ncbi:T9SS type A sorting domain-containing protein [Polaribacter sp.]|nr:T9SS type A sorting domain-containing protein [Polaribacter sp.]
MNKKLQKHTLLLLTFIGLLSWQTNAQEPVVTLVNIVQVNSFMVGETATFRLTYKTDKPVTDPDIACTERLYLSGTGTVSPGFATLTLPNTNGAEATVDMSFTWPSGFDSGTYDYRIFNPNPKTDMDWAPYADNYVGRTKSPGSGSFDPLVGYLGLNDLTVTVTAPACTVATDVSGLATAGAGSTQLDLSWTDSVCFDEVLVVAKAASAVTVTPSGDGTAYTANAAFGSGTDLGTNEYAVYKGVGNSVSVTGLTDGTDYHFTVFTRKGTTWSTGVVGNKIATTGPITVTSHPGVSGADDNSTMNWEDGTTWIGGTLPSSIDNVIIKGRVVINSSDVTINDLTISAHDAGNTDPLLSSQVSLGVAAGRSITVDGDANTSGDLFAQSTSTSFGSFILKGSVTGFVSYYRSVNTTPNNDLIAFGVDGMSVAANSAGFAVSGWNKNRLHSNTATANADDGDIKLLGPFNNATGAYVNYSKTTDAAVTFTPGKGYRMATATANTLLFKSNSHSTSTPITIPITDESATNASSGEWNLIGNPFPSYINFSSFFTANTGEFDAGSFNAVYGYDGDGTFTAYNALNAPAKISPLQGFFVKAKTGGGTVTFNQAWQEVGTADDFIAGKSANQNKALSKLVLENGDESYATSVYFADNATKDLNPGYDSGAFFQQTKGIFTRLVENSDGTPMTIQALAYEDFNDVSIPLDIRAEAGSQLTIKIDASKSTLSNNINVYLEDTVNNTLTLLNEDNFTFMPSEELNGSGRFYVRYSSKALSTETLSLNKLEIYSSNKTIFINGTLKNNAKASIFDIRGRVVKLKNIEVNTNRNTISIPVLNTGVYIVKVNNGNQVETKKVIIN